MGLRWWKTWAVNPFHVMNGTTCNWNGAERAERHCTGVITEIAVDLSDVGLRQCCGLDFSITWSQDVHRSIARPEVHQCDGQRMMTTRQRDLARWRCAERPSGNSRRKVVETGRLVCLHDFVTDRSLPAIT